MVSIGKYEIFDGSVGFQLNLIAQGMHEHDYAIIPEESYEGLKGQNAFFQKEEKQKVVGSDGVKRKIYHASFTEEGHDYVLETTKCRHPNVTHLPHWRYILKITRDGEELAHSRLTFEKFQALYFAN